MPKKRTVCPLYTKDMQRVARLATTLPLKQHMSVHAAIADALRFRRASHPTPFGYVKA